MKLISKLPVLLYAAAAALLLAGCSSPQPSATDATSGGNAASVSSGGTAVQTDPVSPQTASPAPTDTAAVVYQNTAYGFAFTLPQTWKGYTIVSSQWQGLAIDGEAGDKVVQTGPLLSIRDPRWTAKQPRQDIPVMVFTLAQWDALQKEQFHIGAAPIGPSELGRNNKYVFALPARYNFAFPEGYEEVETILNGNPLQPTQLP